MVASLLLVRFVVEKQFLVGMQEQNIYVKKEVVLGRNANQILIVMMETLVLKINV
jgi:hypothetical protein